MPEPAEGESFRTITRENLAEMQPVVEALLAVSGSTAEYVADIRRGRIVGFVILYQDEVVHYSFLFLRNKTACILGLDRHSALIGNAFTIPGYRGRRAQPRSVKARCHLAREAGYERIVAETSPDNLASQKGMQKGGMLLLGRMDLALALTIFVFRWRRPSGFRLWGLCTLFG
jgi:RimJ/RimL family protein N-acetyltransferase